MLAWTMWSFVLLLLLSENDMWLVSGFALIPSSSSTSSLSSHLHLLPTMTPRSGRGSGGLGLVPTITTPSITRRGIPTTTTAAATTTTRSTTTLWAIRCEDKYYQLEEMEDAENCTTELFLKKDGTVEIGKTDGPVWIMAQGSWHIIQGTDKFVMTIVKTFQTGSTTRDMGEFEFDVIRTYQGDMIYVGESVAITGIMKHNKMATNNKFNNNNNNNNIREDEDEEEDNEETVGFFNMIDGTDIRLDRRDDARPSSDVDVTKVELKNDATATHRGAEGMDLSLSTTIASSSSTTRSTTSSTSTSSSVNGRSSPISFGGGGPAQEAQQQQVQQQQPWQQQPSWQTGQQQQQPWQQPWQTGQRQEQQQQPAQVPVQQQQQQQQQPWQQQPWQQQQPQQQPTVVAQQQQEQQEEMTRTMTNQKTSMDLPEGWEQHYDGGQQSYYYFNKATGLSQWERPQQPFDGVTVAVVDSQSSSSSSSLSLGVQQEQQQATTTTTTYTKPNPLAAGWEQYYDTNQQAYYYHNQATGLSQWEKPS